MPYSALLSKTTGLARLFPLAKLLHSVLDAGAPGFVWRMIEKVSGTNLVQLLSWALLKRLSSEPMGSAGLGRAVPPG